MDGIKAVFYKELLGYFATPLAYIFISLFLFASGIFTFYLGNFYERGIADLASFFIWLPWLFLFFIPAISMRLWAEEKKTGTIEILLSLPIQIWQMVLGKFLAAWSFAIIALLLTFPLWITVNYLGNPDNGVIFASYIGGIFLAGSYLAIGSCISTLTNNQVIAFVLTITVCFLFNLTGFPVVMNFFTSIFPQFLLDVIVGFSFLSHFQDITLGILNIKSLIYFTFFIILWLGINSLILTLKKE